MDVYPQFGLLYECRSQVSNLVPEDDERPTTHQNATANKFCQRESGSLLVFIRAAAAGSNRSIKTVFMIRRHIHFQRSGEKSDKYVQI